MSGLTPLPCVLGSDLAITEKFGDALNFSTKAFSPDKQADVASDPDTAMMSEIKVSNACVAYGAHDISTWIMIHLEDLNRFTGAPQKMEIRQQEEVAKMIILHFSHLAVEEILLFFHLLKLGKFGQFYGSVDPMMITTALSKYDTYRRQERARIQEEQDKRAREEARTKWEQEKMSLEEYEKQKGVKTFIGQRII